MVINHFFDKSTSTFTHIVADPKTNKCAVIDPVLNFNPETKKASYDSINQVCSFIQENNYNVEWILETHIHADHLTAAHFLKQKMGGQIGIGKGVIKVLQYWLPKFNLQSKKLLEASQFDYLFNDGELFNIGDISVKVIATPGHTPSCISYLVEDEAVFVGDMLLMPHIGTARADFPGGSAKELYKSIQKIFSLSDDTKILTCHDYPQNGMEASPQSTVKEQKENNVMINTSIQEIDYINARQTKDIKMPAPRLLEPSIRVNIHAGNIIEAGGIYKVL